MAEVADHAAQIEHDAELLHRQQRVTLERLQSSHREVAQAERHVGEVAEQTETDAAPAYLCVHGLRDFRLHPCRNAVAEEEGKDEQQEHQGAEDRGDTDGELAARAHGAFQRADDSDVHDRSEYGTAPLRDAASGGI